MKPSPRILSLVLCKQAACVAPRSLQASGWQWASEAWLLPLPRLPQATQARSTTHLHYKHTVSASTTSPWAETKASVRAARALIRHRWKRSKQSGTRPGRGDAAVRDMLQTIHKKLTCVWAPWKITRTERVKSLIWRTVRKSAECAGWRRNLSRTVETSACAFTPKISCKWLISGVICQLISPHRGQTETNSVKAAPNPL